MATDEPADPLHLVGSVVDDCTIQRLLGAGDRSLVYLAEHTKLKALYAIKILRPSLTAGRDTVMRFFREAQTIARLNHPAIIGSQNVGQAGERYFLRMELVDGPSAETLVREQGKLDWRTATRIVLAIAEALGHAHSKGYIHRDVCPAHILLTKAGQPKLAGFALAVQLQAVLPSPDQGTVVGAPAFTSPEQAAGRVADARADIYSLGATYYYLVTGSKGHEGKTLEETYEKHFYYTPESPRTYAPSVPEAVCEIIARCIKKTRKDRYQTAEALAEALRAVLATPEPEEDLATLVGRARPGFMPAKRPLPSGGEAQPLLVFMEIPAFAVLVSELSSLPTFWARTSAEALAAVVSRPFAAVLSLSPTKEPGTARTVIEAVRSRNPDALTIYHGRDYRLEVSGEEALRCKADLVMLGGVDTNDFMAFVMTGLQLRASGELPTPPTLAWYEEALRQLCPKSHFREMAEQLRSRGVEPFEDK